MKTTTCRTTAVRQKTMCTRALAQDCSPRSHHPSERMSLVALDALPSILTKTRPAQTPPTAPTSPATPPRSRTYRRDSSKYQPRFQITAPEASRDTGARCRRGENTRPTRRRLPSMETRRSSRRTLRPALALRAVATLHQETLVAIPGGAAASSRSLNMRHLLAHEALNH